MPRRKNFIFIVFIFISIHTLQELQEVHSFLPHIQIQRNSNIRIVSSLRSVECKNNPRCIRFQPLFSHIESIRCRNFGGMVNGNVQQGDGNIVINLGNGANLVAVTGETGSGKSLLIAKVVEYLMGCKASTTILPSTNESTYAAIKVTLKLTEPHLSLSLQLMEEAGLNPTLIKDSVKDDIATLHLTRMILENESKSKKKQLKSICKVNGQLCTLRALKILVTPLIAIVDAPKAAGALSKPKSRMDILDSGVDSAVLSRAREAKNQYRTLRRNRERIEEEYASRVLPSSFSSGGGEENLELLCHWIEELDEFENRINTLRDSILSSRGIASLLKDDDEDDKYASFESSQPHNSLAGVLSRFAECSWTEDSKTSYESNSISNSYYSILLDLRDCVKKLDDQVITAQATCDLLSSLSSPESVAFALEEARNGLYDVSSDSDNCEVAKATEKAHDLMNQLENALNKCVAFMENDPNGLLSTITKARERIHLSIEDIDAIITDWGMLSRKHGINTFSLPSLQRSLQQELNGNVEAKVELPRAKAMEAEALKEFEEACIKLSNERLALARKLSQSVSNRIKSLGMEGSAFEAKLQPGSQKCTDSSSFCESSILGVDTLDFMLLHRQINSEGPNSRKNENNEKDDRGGNLEVVGSSGEKARILLAIETDLPGSIGACCNNISLDTLSSCMISPVAVVYDEIDAHVGGRAAVALARLLSDQTRGGTSDIVKDSRSKTRTQIISITHSPSVAAVADRHIVIQKLPMNQDLNGIVEVLAKHVTGPARREELARMASGDLAPDEEGLRFADALLKQGFRHKEKQ